jgi:hypothetical protein
LQRRKLMMDAQIDEFVNLHDLDAEEAAAARRTVEAMRAKRRADEISLRSWRLVIEELLDADQDDCDDGEVMARLMVERAEQCGWRDEGGGLERLTNGLFRVLGMRCRTKRGEQWLIGH